MCDICKSTPCKPTCPNALDPPIIAVCHHCGNKLRYDYTYFRDKYGNTFCSRECVEKYYDIQEYDWTENDMEYTYHKAPVLWKNLTYNKHQSKYKITKECNHGNY